MNISYFSSKQRPDWWAWLVPCGLLGLATQLSGTLSGLAILLAIISALGRIRSHQANLQLAQEIAANHHLTAEMQQLATMQQFTAALNAGQNVDRLQEIVLNRVTAELGYRQAVIGLIDSEKDVLNGWFEWDGAHQEPLYHPTQLPIEDNEPLQQALQKQALTQLESNNPFHIDKGLIVPLVWGSESLAVLIVAPHTAAESHQQLLTQIAQQTAVRLGTMTIRSRRARESTIQEERTRIAIDLHDTVSQSLFGIVFTLDACLKLLPQQPIVAIPELQKALDTADAVRQEIRQSVHDLWPHSFTAGRFEQDLRRYMTDTLQAVELTMTFEIRGNFGAMSPAVRRSLYRICQESLNNVVHHAEATEAKVCLDIYQQRVQLAVRDNGRGFQPSSILNLTRGREQFGLRGMQERVLSFGGTCDVFSQPRAGTSIIIDLPLNPSQESR